MRSTRLYIAFLLLAGVALSSCQHYRNFTTYYNRMWNIERIMAEVEDDVDYYRELNEDPQPRYVVPYDPLGGENNEFFSEHLTMRTLTPEEVRTHKIKLDSIILDKGSLLLQRQSQSDYVDDALFYIAKAYFYEREWYQSQQKTIELIDAFPDSRFQPDAHLLLAMDLLKQGEIDEAEEVLSKTVDVAFRFKRLDILTEAFRLNADVQLAQGEVDQAMKPYERAIVLSEDDEEKASWQYDIGVTLFRAGRFEEAVAAFDKVDEYDPSELTRFETGLQKSIALRATGRYDEAEAELDALAGEEDFADWATLIEVERISLESDRSGSDVLDEDALALLDSAGGKGYYAYGFYERAVRAFNAGNYELAYANFTRVQSMKSPFNTKSRDYSSWIGFYKDELRRGANATRIHLLPFPDSLGLLAARSYYNVARFFVKYGREDSMMIYYEKSHKWAPAGSVEGARALYAMSEHLGRSGEGMRADSLLTMLAENYGDNEYAAEARRRLGYTDNFVIDEARDHYLSGRSLMQNAGDYPSALRTFARVYGEYAGSIYAPQALYASGLIYEKFMPNKDSALYYYARLLQRYPESEQAKAIKPVVDAAVAGTGISADSLVSLADADRNGTARPDTTSTTVKPPPEPWFDARLYDPIPELAIGRREKRTSDQK